MTEDDEDLRERVATLEATISDLEDRLDRATSRDIPLMKGTLRAVVGGEIDDIGELPDAGRGLNDQLARYDERLRAVERRLDALGDVETSADTKTEKIAAVLSFALNKHSGQAKVAVSPQEIKGCTGVSRRYAYDLIETIGDEVKGTTVREAREVKTGNGTEHKGKALLVDCESVHVDRETVNEFTTGGASNGRS